MKTNVQSVVNFIKDQMANLTPSVKKTWELNNYDMLLKYDIEPIQGCRNWIHVRDNKYRLFGFASLLPNGKVSLSLGKDYDMKDSIVDKDTFNENYSILAVSDHWGRDIKVA